MTTFPGPFGFSFASGSGRIARGNAGVTQIPGGGSAGNTPSFFWRSLKMWGWEVRCIFNHTHVRDDRSKQGILSFHARRGKI